MRGAAAWRGGRRNNTFVFDTTLGPTNVDTITDFTRGVDRIDLRHAIFPHRREDLPGAHVVFFARFALSTAARPGFTTCRARPKARASGGTSSVMTLPEPT